MAQQRWFRATVALAAAQAEQVEWAALPAPPTPAVARRLDSSQAFDRRLQGSDMGLARNRRRAEAELQSAETARAAALKAAGRA